MKNFRRSRFVNRIAVLAPPFLLAACASVSPPAASPVTQSGNPNPPANVNLSGYPLEFRQGYADGCTSARGPAQRDETRYKADSQYRQGWEDGKSICQRR
jgi:hypothetical protein